ncbi:aminoglycoside phosphotransferase family protein [Paenibacillus sacheonensis]|uniref:Phosphotransferase n=1 Tax=Paenibacillus sacheonensis TaxID=742054 RepID=A0A7X4YVH5_9BACL|nr:aminoglycoside phosphotransferase family protein [Paenibacillus sacheonensis]MBM7568558.1 aminoglycoside phosphotransferase (APT) family kinase protein [Paenibacillus sacheonensis]NBC72381.1 phosphotransferase [Paenibacillus sacheonensis]
MEKSASRGTAIGAVNWIEKKAALDELLMQADKLSVQPMDQGFEAEVRMIRADIGSFVLKVWNRSSKPDIRFQYRLLDTLSERGLSVSSPVGWGIDENGNQVLLTSFDGTPIRKVNERKLADLAGILSSIHRIRVEELEDRGLQLPKYEMIHYFFPGIDDHPDLARLAMTLVQRMPIRQDRIIHGDFHLANLLEDNGRYTVIDWTNGQLGDARYDFAWALTLLRIYASDRNAARFRAAYLLDNEISREELEAFGALACLRWLLLHRGSGVPAGPTTMKRVKSLIAGNPFLAGMAAGI